MTLYNALYEQYLRVTQVVFGGLVGYYFVLLFGYRAKGGIVLDLAFMNYAAIWLLSFYVIGALLCKYEIRIKGDEINERIFSLEMTPRMNMIYELYLWITQLLCIGFVGYYMYMLLSSAISVAYCPIVLDLAAMNCLGICILLIIIVGSRVYKIKQA